MAPFGIQMNRGLNAYFDHVNAQGGVNGRKIELRARDDKYEPALAAQNTREFIEDDVLALIGYFGTPTSTESMPIFSRAQVPFFGPSSGAEVLRNPFNRYIFTMRASYNDETEKIVEQLLSIGIESIAVLHQTDAYGQAGLIGVERAMASRKMEIAATAPVHRNGAGVLQAVQTISALSPDAVIMIAGYTPAAKFVRGMREAGYAGQFYSLSLVGAKTLANTLGSDGYGVAISQVVPNPWSPAPPVIREYQTLLKAAAVPEYAFCSLEGFLVAKAFVEGLTRAGPDLTRERLIAALETMTNVDLGGFVFDFSASNHNGSKFVELTLIARGKFIV